jgi:hypothetical protein
LIFLGASNNNGEGAPMISKEQVLLRQILYGIVVSLFFSLITFTIEIPFRKIFLTEKKCKVYSLNNFFYL